MTPKPAQPGRPEVTQTPSNTLRLGGSELTKLVGDINGSAAGEQSFKRSHFRWPFQQSAIRMEVRHPSGAQSTLLYACRNISSGGISLLHSAYMHVGTRVIVHVPKPGGNTGLIAAPGQVVRCRHVRGSVHEIGVKFDQPVEIREVLDLDPLEGRFTLEQVDPDKLRGTLLHVEDSVTDRRLVRHFLRETQLNVIAVESAQEAFKRLGEGFDAVLCDYLLAGGTGADVCLELRQKDIRVPVILTSADSTREVKDAVRACQADAFLAKPFTRELLLRALAEFLLVSRVGTDRSGALYTTLGPDDPMRQMVPEFITEAQALGKRLRALTEPAQLEEAIRVCVQLKSGSAPMGFERLAQTADRALAAARAGGPAAAAAIHQLAALCERLAEQRSRGKRDDNRAAA
jgi:chemotaxis family two-component system response regulator PixH